ncbi:diguanylate cyclase [Candidatus Sumerlaeota bacterium]|nr:diguanylate cyclase [Candidatus Sumerlaeota bacterium]
MEREKLSVLLIDDDPGDAELLYRQLDDIPGREIEFFPFTDYESGLAELRQREIDVIFIDYLLGAQTGIDALRALKAAGISRPIIMLTGQGNEKVAVEAMKAGAADYLIKRFTSTDDLHRALLNALEKWALHQKIEEQQKELERLAKTDGLTGLYNRRFFIERLIEEMNEARKGGTPLSLLMLDLDHFKKVNDTYGHLVGDDVLVRSADRIRHIVRASDVIGRFGGEEFCIALPKTDLDQAVELAEKIRLGINSEQYGVSNGTLFNISVSIGAAQLQPDAKDITPLIRDADNALYRAKESGRNRVCK